jgi:hypothetical protein
MNHQNELDHLLRKNPSLCYDGVQAPYMTREFFETSRQKIKNALPEIELCRKVFREDRFKKQCVGKQTAYRLKHVVERWEFDEKARSLSATGMNYNGLYVSQGSAAAAALLEGFEVRCIGRGGPASVILVPRPGPASAGLRRSMATRLSGLGETDREDSM